jgi:Cu(I)/Ag(I) efflux system membrane protein CusA/SilA
MLKPAKWSHWTSLALAVLAGVPAALVTYPLLRWGLGEGSHWSGWPTALGVGVLVGALVYRLGREEITPAEENVTSRWVHGLFRPMLRWTLDHKGLFLLLPAAVVVMGLVAWLGFARVAWPVGAGLKALGHDPTETRAWAGLSKRFPGLGREFMPPLDEGSFLFMPSLLPSASLAEVQAVVAAQDAAIAKVPEVASVVGKPGRAESALDPAPIGMIETVILLKPESQWRMVRQDRWHTGAGWLGWARPALTYMWPEERRITKQEILQELQAVTRMPGVLPTWLQPIQTRIVMLQSGFRAMMGVKVFGSDPKEIERIALQMEKILRRVPGAADVVADRIVGKPYVEYHIDRVAIARHGVNIRDVQDILEVAIGGENLTTTVEGRERYPVRVRYPRELRTRLEDLGRVLVPTSSGAHVPIAQVAKIRHVLGPQELKSENGLLVGYVTMNTRERDEVSVVEDAERLRLDPAVAQREGLQSETGYYRPYEDRY